MPITAQQKESRKAHIGSSDMAALLGLDGRRNAYDIWLDKTGRLEDQVENEAMYAGTMFEDGILNHAEAKLGKLTRNQYRSAKDKGLPIAANIDAILIDSGLPVEVKTSGLYGPLTDVWGDAGTDAVPDKVIVQAQVHLLCTDKELCHIAAFLGGRGFQMFAVPRDKEIIDIIASTAQDFWTKNVLADMPPTNILPHPAIIKRVRRVPETIVSLDQSLVDEWQEAKTAEKEAKTRTETALTAILATLGDAEAGQAPAGLFTYLEQSRASYQVQAGTFRVARWKKSK